MEAKNPVRFEARGALALVTIDRFAEARNAVDRQTAEELASAFRRFDADESLSVAVLSGEGGVFCAGADLKQVADPSKMLRLADHGDGPMGYSRLMLSKPVIAAVEGYAVAGGLELAIWCDLRVAARDAVFGVFCRRWGVPLMDGGTIRLARLIGHSHALDMILTGRGVSGDEAQRMGLANRLVEKGKALETAIALAEEIAAFPQRCMRSDRLASYEQWSMSLPEALRNEFYRGKQVVDSGETMAGAQRFVEGTGRHGSFDAFKKR
ncbi:MAG TPA: crotonase/enoyl-CoA hydratase family protein [Labilithrix sp.]|jgi:enoyl-CoA hydratase